jgi:KDO2-lipid IV(A) lauroyltransferase
VNWKVRSVEIFSKLLRPGWTSGCAAAFLRAPLRLFSPRWRVAALNLSIAFPEKSEAERKKILGETYDHLVWTGIEFIVLQKNPRAALDWVEAENGELLDELDGKGAILLTGHVGNWELTAAWIAQSGHRVTAIVRESDDEGERGLIEGMRERAGLMCLSKNLPMTRSVSILKRGEFLGILPDQHGGPLGLSVPFFGVETSTSPGAAVFAYLTGKPLIPIFSRRVAPFRHKVRFGPPIEWERLESRDAAIFAITKKINETVERMIREAPGQWLAQHRRFRELGG